MSRADRPAKGIYWDRSLNCFTGCSPVGAGCDNCWAKRTAEGRLRGRCGYPADEPFRPTFHPERLKQVNPKQKPQVIALCFMSDPFHEEHELSAIYDMLDKVIECSQHTFIALTKRYENMRDILDCYGKPIPNLVGGVSVWDQESADRMISVLLETNLATRIVSFEPALNGINFSKWLNIGVNNEKERADISKPISNRELFGKSDGANMEASPKERGENSLLRRNITKAAASGEEHVRRLSKSNVFGGSKANDSICPQDCLDDSQSSRYSGRDGDQSQRRGKKKQSPNQSRPDDSFSKYDTQLPSAREEEKGSGRGEKLFGKIDQRRSSSNTPSVQGERIIPKPDSKNVQCESAGSMQYSSAQNLDSPCQLDGIFLGGESGPGARPMHPDIPRSVRDQCQAANIPFLFKQWGEWEPIGFQHAWSIPGWRHTFEDGQAMNRVGKKAAGRMLDGRTWDELPEVLK